LIVDHRWSARVIGLWLASILAFLAYNYVRMLARRMGLPFGSIVPAFHFLFYLHACLAIGVGITIGRTAGAVAANLTGTVSARAAWVRSSGVAVLTMGMLALSYPGYLGREQFGPRLQGASEVLEAFPVGAWTWIRGNTHNGDVFLSTDEMSLYVVTPAARKVVATSPYFSNPYVDWDRRDRDRNRMFQLLQEGDRAGFHDLARQYGVTHVIWSDEVTRIVRGTLGMRVKPAVRGKDLMSFGLLEVFEDNGVTIFRVAP
jgi:hypothetical protein